MTRSVSYRVATVIGLGLLALHAAALPWLLDRAHRPALVVELDSTPATDALDLSATLPAELSSRVRWQVDGTTLAGQTALSGRDPAAIGQLPAEMRGPGLHRIAWQTEYRGGFRDRVETSQLVGPFQDLSSPPCSMWVVIGQKFLGERRSGALAPGTLAAVLGDIIDREMAGFEQWPIGAFVAASEIDMRWIAFDDIDGDSRRQAILAATTRPPAGILRVSLVLRFESVSVPIWLALIPELTDQAILLRTHVEAALAFDNRVYQWIADLVESEQFASRLAAGEIDAALVDAFGLPPAIALGQGHHLGFGYCPGRPIEIVTGSHAAVPMRISPLLGSRHEWPEMAPVQLETRRAPGSLVTGPEPLDAPLAVIFELDAINGILHRLWSSGFLDRQLIAAGLTERFNRDPLVEELLSVRIGEPRLSMPPTVMLAPPKPDQPETDDLFRLGVEVGLTIRDRGAVMPARLFGSVGFGFGDRAPAGLVARLRLDDLALTCRPEPTRLVPCYDHLVAAARDRADDVHGVLSRRFTGLFEDIALDRVIELDDARFRIDRASVHTRRAQPGAQVQVDLFGALTTR